MATLTMMQAVSAQPQQTQQLRGRGRGTEWREKPKGQGQGRPANQSYGTGFNCYRCRKLGHSYDADAEAN